MIEVILISLSLAHDPFPSRLLERFLDLLLAAMAHALQLVEGEDLPQHARLAQDLLRERRQPAQPLPNHRADALWRGEWSCPARSGRQRPPAKVRSPCSWSARVSWRMKKALPSLRA